MHATRIEEEVTIAKPVAQVFAAWASAEALADWFAPMAVRKPDVELDFRVGGRYSIRMPLPDGQVFTTTGVFEEIVSNRKIVMSWRCDAFPDPETRVSVQFLPTKEGTTIRVRHEMFESPDTCADHKHGWQLCLAELQATLES